MIDQFTGELHREPLSRNNAFVFADGKTSLSITFPPISRSSGFPSLHHWGKGRAINEPLFLRIRSFSVEALPNDRVAPLWIIAASGVNR